MNILYPLIAVPFVKLFGLSLAVYRLPMLIISVIAIYLFFYALLKANLKSSKTFIIMMVIFLSPIMIEYSRWTVESNLFPHLMVIFISFLILFINELEKSINDKTAIVYWILFNLIIAISAYAYSNTWIFLVFFIIGVYLFLIWKYKKRSTKFIFISMSILLIFIWPLILFIYVNYISHSQMILFNRITITKLTVNRSASQFVIGHGNSLIAIKDNLINTFKILVTGDDGMPKNTLPFIGAFYPLMLTFAPIGFGFMVKRRMELINTVIFISFFACLPGIAIILPNFTHLSPLMLPLLYMEAIGVYYVCSTQSAKIIFTGIFLSVLCIYIYTYFVTRDYDLHNTAQETPTELKYAIYAANSLHRKVMIISPLGRSMYVVPRFYSPISPYKFNEIKANEKEVEHTYYRNYGKWYFDDHLDSQPNKSWVYLVHDSSGTNNELRKMNSKKYGTYTLYWK
ncbi:hypothetical protein NP061_005090 [Weissella confusa]|uniref:Glycosyltransferase RgtA/B/C/D-like domain-containing protein n=1 Tax=Limosilactobacillus reuteri TaxID=1598 RepID=A0A2T5Q3U8_LIMRT|nr:hypothetical protein [Limosilactobacillus reuteri]MCW3763740.1 hypothetical protein [Weissella confusa]PTV04114.1 hypothetical protein DB325_04765 [Limosilactobacillus reuteri]